MTNIILHCYNPIHNHYYLDNYNFNKLYKNLDNIHNSWIYKGIGVS